MKYKVGTRKNIENINGNAIKSLVSFQYVSIILPVNAIAINIAKITQSNCLGKLPIKFLSWLFKNILSSVYFTLLCLTTKYGINNTVSQNNPLLRYLYLPTNTLKNKPKLIPSQNMRFQKLSLFSLALIQSIKTLSFKIHKAIVSRFSIQVKQLIKWLVIIFIGFSQNIALAQNLSKLISSVEKEYHIPSGLLNAIARVGSGLHECAINIAGRPMLAKSSLEASKIIRPYLKKGYTNIDIGIAQINWHWHGYNFKSVDEMLIPENNIRYAAKVLTDLYKKHGDWQKVVRFYHSAKPHHHRKYSRKVLLSWLSD